MKVLDRPEAAKNLKPAPPRAVLYYTPGLDLAPYAELLHELGLPARCVAPPELVDVKAPRVYLIGDDALADPGLMRAIEDLHGDLAAAIVVADASRQHETPDWAFAYLEAPPHLSELRFGLQSALRQIGLHERARNNQRDLD